MRTRGVVVQAFLAIAVLVGTSARAESVLLAPPTTAASSDPMEDMCPMAVQGTKVVARDVEGGVAMVFTTNKGDVGAVRRRVGRMAETHGTNAAGMMTTTTVTGMHHLNPKPVIHREPLPAATASASDVDHGAELVLRPNSPADLAGLRNQVRSLAKSMAHLHGECPGMGEPGPQASN